MEELKIPEALCAYLNASGVAEFVPEVWREGAASVRLTGGVGAQSIYVDGSRLMSVPFEVRLRCPGRAIADRLTAVEIFRRLGSYVRTTPMPIGNGQFAEIRETGGASKSAVYENGEEEYRCGYVMRFFREAE